MPECRLREIFALPRIENVEVNLSDGTNFVDDLSVWHRRCAHTSASVLIEAHKRMAVMGMRLHRKYMTKKGKKQAINKTKSKQLCKACALMKRFYKKIVS